MRRMNIPDDPFQFPGVRFKLTGGRLSQRKGDPISADGQCRCGSKPPKGESVHLATVGPEIVGAARQLH